MTARTIWRCTVRVAVVMGPSVPAHAGAFPECAARAYAQAASASQDWEHGLRALMVKVRPVVELERQGQARRDWRALHDYVRTSLSASPQFQGLLKRLQERELGIEQLLKSCQPAQ